jgi:hypothetical protein
MKKIYYLLVLLVIVGASCSDKRKKTKLKVFRIESQRIFYTKPPV